jgi:hypothetical protein
MNAIHCNDVWSCECIFANACCGSTVVHQFLGLLIFLTTLSLIDAKASPEGAGSLLHVLNTDQSEIKRLEALQSLEETGGIDAQQIARSICDTSAQIRAAMVRLGTPMAMEDSELELRLIALSNDKSPIVQMQMLKSLPHFSSSRAATAFRKLLAASLHAKDAELRSLAESLQKTP